MQSTAKLIPMDVAARVVNADTKVPQLTDKPFEASGTLEKGIHIHWALPDSLTRARLPENEPPRFQGVPDLWLIVRYNPVRGSDKRTYLAWVLDSFEEKVVPLVDWQPPEARDETKIHTAPGVIRRITKGFTNGWGQWDNDQPFDPLTTAYYPSCRARLGFYDDLSDLTNVAAGTVSYTVVGWYSRASFDPFYSRDFKRSDRLGHRADLRTNKIFSSPVSKGNLHSDLHWDPTVSVTHTPKPTKAEATKLRTAINLRSASIQTTSKALDRMIAALPLSPNDSPHVVVDSLMPDSVKTYTVCHGSVMDVPLRETSLIGISTLPADKIFLYPNMHRAMAEIASKTTQEQQIDWLDMMIGNLGQQSGSFSGVVDLPGAQHAHTFQAVPGKASYYARLDIHSQVDAPAKQFDLADLTDGASMSISGHWPMFRARSASTHFNQIAKVIPSQFLNQPPVRPVGPTDAEIVTWIGKLRSDFATARQQSGNAGKPLDPRLIRIQDHRENAQPTPQGHSVDGFGPDQAGWWIDMGDENEPIDIAGNPEHKALAELRRSIGGARVHMPEVGNIFGVPGPRWYRPWSPHLVVFSARRSYRHGQDGRFREDGHLTTRVSGESMIGLRVGNATVLAKDLLRSQPELRSAGLPSVVGELIQEHALMDAENAGIMAKVARVNADPHEAGRPTEKQMVAASRAVWLKRGNLLQPAEKSAIDLIVPIGTPSSAAGLQAWRDWYGPLFLDTRYTHRRKSFNKCWQLPAEHVEVVDQSPGVAPDLEREFIDRQIATVSAVKVMKSLFVTEESLDPHGKWILKKLAPEDVDATTFDEMDVVSTSLNKIDEQLFEAGEREHGGFVHMNEVRLFDTFGTSVKWASDNASLHQPPAWATPLPARLTCWGRLNFRLQSSADTAADATPLTPPVCGFLLPDFVDQALEVHDITGAAIGQLTADDPVRKNQGPARTLSVKFTLLPWVEARLPAGADPTSAIENATLRALVRSLLAQTVVVPANSEEWHETGFTAMLRVFDTVRSTLDPSRKSSDTRVRLLGEPIVVMNARLFFEASSSPPMELKNGTQLVVAPADLPVLRVRVGDVTRPDDGVLGCFLIGDSPENGRFAPVSLEAATKAILNQMVFEDGASKVQEIRHPFIKDQVTEFDLPANKILDTAILADPRGSLYATCGLLPRKTIIIPHDFIDPLLKQLEPTFAVGPVLGYKLQETLIPVVPPPKIDGMDADFVQDNGSTYPKLPMSAQIPVAELPSQRVRLTGGWVRMFTAKPGNS